MSVSGYSDKPLTTKLGYLAGDGVFTLLAPGWFIDELLEQDIKPVITNKATWGHAFLNSRKELHSFLEDYDLEQFEKGLWVSWPKKASGVETDLTEQTFRDVILPLGWVDTKVCAIDDTWSGLKFLRRKH